MTSYEFYVCKYGGKAVQPDEWQTAYADADALIRRYERLYRVELSHRQRPRHGCMCHC